MKGAGAETTQAEETVQDAQLVPGAQLGVLREFVEVGIPTMQCRVWKGGTSHLVYELGKYSNHFRITPMSDYFKQPCSPTFLNLGNARVYMYMCIYTYIYIYMGIV